MKNNTIQDERILSERRKIQSTGYAWIIMVLLISIIIQQFFMKAPFAQYAAEFFILIGTGIYNTAANYKKGIDIWNPARDGKKKIFLTTLLTGVISVILLAILSGNNKVNDLASYLIIFVTIMFTSRLIMIGINDRKQRAIDKELDHDDMAE